MINKNKQLNIKLSAAEMANLKKKTHELKFSSVSEYVRFIIINVEVEVKIK